jgi:hypothetical protein
MKILYFNLLFRFCKKTFLFLFIFSFYSLNNKQLGSRHSITSIGCISKSLLQTMPRRLCFRVDFNPSVFLILLWRIVKVEFGFKSCGIHDLPQETFAERSNRPRILDSCDCIHNRRIENIGRIRTTKLLLLMRSLAVIVSIVGGLGLAIGISDLAVHVNGFV